MEDSREEAAGTDVQKSGAAADAEAEAEEDAAAAAWVTGEEAATERLAGMGPRFQTAAAAAVAAAAAAASVPLATTVVRDGANAKEGAKEVTGCEGWLFELLVGCYFISWFKC